MGSLSKICVVTLIYPAQLLWLFYFFIYSLLFETEFCSKKKKKKKAVKNGLITYPCLLCLTDFPFGCAEPHKREKKVLCVSSSWQNRSCSHSSCPALLWVPSRALKPSVSRVRTLLVAVWGWRLQLNLQLEAHKYSGGAGEGGECWMDAEGCAE